MMITDSHCHLASGRYAREELADLIGNARAAGVGRMVTLATAPEDVERNLEIASEPGIRCGLGIHPCDVHGVADGVLEEIAPRLADERVCVVGETGLDYFHPAPEGLGEEEYRARQREFLRRHFELAAGAGLNVVVHTRDRDGIASFEDAMDIYGDFAGRVRAVFHCFILGWEEARRVIGAGGVVSFGGVATFKKSDAVRATVKRCPRGSFMLETDAPYLSPEPYRGKRNEPAGTARVAEVIAAARGESVEELAAHTEAVADEFFRWGK